MLEDKAEDVDVSVYDYVQYTFFCGISIPYVYPKSDGSYQDLDLLLDGLGMNNIIEILLGFHISCPIRKIRKLDDLLLKKLNGIGTRHNCGE